jgi:hypothetical protein
VLGERVRRDVGCLGDASKPASGYTCTARIGPKYSRVNGARSLPSSELVLQAGDPGPFQAPRPIGDTTLTVRGSAPAQHAIGNWREPTRNNRQTADSQNREFTGPSKIRTSAMTSGYYRTSSPVTVLPMIMRWISEVPSKSVKLVEVRAVSAGR